MKYRSPGIVALVSLAFLTLLLAGCIGPGQPVSPAGEETPAPPAGQETPVIPGAPAPAPISATEESVVAANNRFAFDLYRQLAGEEEENIFVSPFSISSALAVTYEGARGTTAGEIREVLHFPDDITVMREEYAEIIAGITSRSSASTLRTANALWAEQSYSFLPEYITTAGRFYSAEITNLDFIGKPDQSRLTINAWVEEETGDRIRDLLPPGSIDPRTRLVITNAIYFKGTWVKQFDEKDTTDQDFRTGGGGTVQVPMMRRGDKDAVYGYAETDILQVLSMPYESDHGKELSMLVILPKNDDLKAVEEFIDAESLSDIRKNLTSRQVIVYFPKFSLERKYFLPDTLSAMGMPTAFSRAADFSGMDGSGNLFIDDIIHQAWVAVDEEGTEAAAATTAVVGLISSNMPEAVPVFRADHPFIFLIQDDETGNILFMGRVADPAGG
ncbi:MAG: serpin family protein [Methanomicrobiales archaeon]|nr:serpin family protein [Methanomicrobiales archaeon]